MRSPPKSPPAHTRSSSSIKPAGTAPRNSRSRPTLAPAVAAALTRAQQPRKYLAIHAPELAIEPATDSGRNCGCSHRPACDRSDKQGFPRMSAFVGPVAFWKRRKRVRCSRSDLNSVSEVVAYRSAACAEVARDYWRFVVNLAPEESRASRCQHQRHSHFWQGRSCDC